MIQPFKIENRDYYVMIVAPWVLEELNPWTEIRRRARRQLASIGF